MRLGKHATRFQPLELAGMSMAAMAVLSDVWLVADFAGAVAAGEGTGSVWAGSRCAHEGLNLATYCIISVEGPCLSGLCAAESAVWFWCLGIGPAQCFNGLAIVSDAAL